MTGDDSGSRMLLINNPGDLADGLEYPIISAEATLPNGESLARRQWSYLGSKIGIEIPLGVSNKNTILDTCIYEVEFLDGNQQESTAYIIMENLYSQIPALTQKKY